MTPEEIARDAVEFGKLRPVSEEVLARKIREAIREAEADLRAEIHRLRADLEAARANARHYVGLALEQQNQKDMA